jgi:hypothetical protein
MLRMVCASFGLAHEGMNKATLLHNLEVIARTRFAEGKRILLVVDEAQNLPAGSLEELRMLANFQVEGRSLFQSFLLGQDGLRRTLQTDALEQLRQRIIASYNLEPLSTEETRAYIEHRLKTVDWEDDPELAEGVFDGIFEFTGGVPRRINALCDRFLLYGCIEEKHLLDTDDLAVVVAEMRREVGHETLRPDDHPLPDAEAVQTPVPSTGIAAVPAVADADMHERIRRLEMEVARLRETVQHERKLLRKAVLLQLDLNAYDDID